LVAQRRSLSGFSLRLRTSVTRIRNETKQPRKKIVRVKTNSTSGSAFFIPRVALGGVLCSASVFLAIAALNKSVAETPARKAATTQPGTSTTHVNTKLTYKIIDAPKQTYGYDVFVDGRLMIHQTSAPALPGNEGFRTKEDATKVALLVVDKIKKGERPPTISIDEMKKLKVIN
jgi:hypothetical protein